MSLAEELAGDQTGVGRHGCTVCEWLNNREASERSEFERAFKDNTWMTSTIQRAMRRRGAAVTASTVGRHRRDHIDP
jgi:hypothetical protein